jgi:hypothetical protein
MEIREMQAKYTTSLRTNIKCVNSKCLGAWVDEFMGFRAKNCSPSV